MEHTPYVPADGHCMLSETQQDPKERGTQGRSWQKGIIQVETTKLVRTVKHDTVLSVVGD